MSRVPRSSLPDGFFHVYARGVAAAGPLFRDDDDRRVFLDLVWRTTRTHRWRCHALCVLGTHYHLVVETSRDALSSGMQRLNGHYARYFNARHRRFGHVFAERFASRVIEDDTYLYDACAYVLLNPVKAGLCERAQDWPWSYCALGMESI
jgi:REP element-mobilizing transposase RayT